MLFENSRERVFLLWETHCPFGHNDIRETSQ
jgi:hypothetical protein